MANNNLNAKLAHAINSGALKNSMQNIISLGNVVAAQPTGQTASFDFNWNSDSHVKKYQICEIDEDLLALSVAWHRIRQDRNNNSHYVYLSTITKLLDKQLFKEVTEPDRDRANIIRDYYSKKIMVWRLKNERFSNFREDMNQFIHGDGKKFKEDVCPLVYRLPEFYDYDLAFDEMSREHNTIAGHLPSSPVVVTKNLKLVKTFNVGKKHSRRKEYWFSDERNDLVTMSVDHHNVLIPLLDLHTKNPFTMEAIYSKKVRDDKEYFVANKFKFA